jgi:hypothetical protein
VTYTLHCVPLLKKKLVSKSTCLVMSTWTGQICELQEVEKSEKNSFTWMFFDCGCSQTWFAEWQCLVTTDLKRIVGMGPVKVTVPLNGYKRN